MDDNFHIKAADILYAWATSDGHWVTQEASDSLNNREHVINEIEAESEGDARLVYDWWDDIASAVQDRIEHRIELEMADG